MEQKDIFLCLAKAALESVKNIPTWSSSILKIKRLEGNIGFESFYTVDNTNEIPIDTEADYKTSIAVHELHKNMSATFGENSRWNRLKFILYPDKTVKIEYIWDEELQNRVDSYNNKPS